MGKHSNDKTAGISLCRLWKVFCTSGPVLAAGLHNSPGEVAQKWRSVVVIGSHSRKAQLKGPTTTTTLHHPYYTLLSSTHTRGEWHKRQLKQQPSCTKTRAKRRRHLKSVTIVGHHSGGNGIAEDLASYKANSTQKHPENRETPPTPTKKSNEKGRT